ncbi:ATP-binding protein [Schaalia sp. Marseille-Q2122]|uniref:ATP-binding protein n=1 Tax=Schaalia sp. Marseille-Q2122 TaxID=2736604 RepID=UPI00158DD72F|nr:ATP-binding protein [Schaalia sp. Marseille-Q2122]
MSPPLIRRNITQIAQETLHHSPVVVISGARQVGKSTLMHILLDALPHKLVNLDSAVSRESALSDPDGFAHQFPDGTLAIDEIQRAPDLLLSIKLAVDQKRSAARFIVTGSADLLTASGTQESLAGRAHTIRLHGLSQGEVRGYCEDFAHMAWQLAKMPPPQPSTTLSRREYLSLATTSAYPEIHNAPYRIATRWMDGYLERVLSKDTADVSNIQHYDRLHPLLSLIAAENSSEFVNQRYAQALDLPARSLPAYVKALSDVYLIHSIPAWGHNLSKRAVSKPKILISDPGIAAYLCGIDVTGLEHDISSALTGGLVEAFVAGELLKQKGWSRIDYSIHHWRDSGNSNHEVDIVLENRAREIVAIEVKSQATLGAKHFTGLKKLREIAGHRFKAGIVLYTGAEIMPFGEGLWAMPINMLWEAR